MVEILIMLFLAAAALGCAIFLVSHVVLSAEKHLEDRRRTRE
jgi:hypothetical protein